MAGNVCLSLGADYLSLTEMAEALGWISSLILLLTVGKQVYKQWHAGTSEGVSKWLFFGQIAASIGFLAYSILITNWVFIVTNSLMIVNSLVGIGILFYHRRRADKTETSNAAPAKLAEQN